MWKDGYSMYRCASANRGSTKQKMLDDLSYFWGYQDSHELPNVYKKSMRYKYVAEDKSEIIEDFNEADAKQNITAMRLVHASLRREGANRLNKRYPVPEQFFEALVSVDEMALVFIDTMAAVNCTRYRVYCRERCVLTNQMEVVTGILRESKEKGFKIRGVACGNKHFCCLYPVNEQPNFAGSEAIGEFM
jgi:hypothetical protein